jgi:hypothetical protein
MTSHGLRPSVQALFRRGASVSANQLDSPSSAAHEARGKPKNACAKKRISRADSMLILLSGPLSKIYCFRFSEKCDCLAPSRLDAEGVSRSSRHVRRGCDGRVGLDGRAMPMRTQKSCGPDTPTLVSSAQNDLRAMGARKPGSQGARKSALKPSRREGQGVFRLNLWSLPRAFFIARGPWVSVDTRPSLRPLISEGARRTKNSGAARRGNAHCWPQDFVTC